MSKLESVVLEKNATLSRWSVLFLEMMASIEHGSVTIQTPEGEILNYRGAKSGPHAHLNILDWKFCEEIFLKGDIGLGESYIKGLWESDEIADLIQFAIDNKVQLERVIRGSVLRILFYRIKHRLNKNSKKGSQKNIHAHYDLGNDFYKLWLDPSMTYSSAFQISTSRDLEEAQGKKYQNILDQLDLKPGDHILEVGCGWGGFMEYAAKKGIRVTGITISKEQYQFAKERLKNFAGLATVELRDYRDIETKYDHVVSIEMFEAIGLEYWGGYFEVLQKALKKNGSLIIQSITINDQDFSSYKKGTDFIQQYIFPGGMLPSPEVFKAEAERKGFKVTGSVEFGLDYAKTLKIWEDNFLEKLEAVKKLGFDEAFIRTWKFYLHYCRGGFEAKKIGVSQFYLTKK